MPQAIHNDRDINMVVYNLHILARMKLKVCTQMLFININISTKLNVCNNNKQPQEIDYEWDPNMVITCSY